MVVVTGSTLDMERPKTTLLSPVVNRRATGLIPLLDVAMDSMVPLVIPVQEDFKLHVLAEESAETVTMATANAPVTQRTLEPVVSSAPTKTCMDRTATTRVPAFTATVTTVLLGRLASAREAAARQTTRERTATSSRSSATEGCG